ncbi:MAG: ABC transporter ATP-binding protein [Chitinophagaceae bacterium]|jgi:lipopolysaccharide transport system ATP-binding protein|nr:ABC transporter ATP-binding protein [Chitinophagaceae bacterium]
MLHNTENIILKVTGLGKAYRIGVQKKKPENITSAIINALLSPIRNFKSISSLKKINASSNESNIFWANRHIDFEISKGEVLGIIGKNGAGKSTLLKMLSRIIDPTEGKIELHGRVASLLEVGTGFNPELTGRENIYLNGTILGLSKKEIEERYNSIVEFSGIEKFIETPVKRYSSGMKVRLAFAVAAHLDPEILIIDEVLAVGDAEFQKKCLGKMQDVANAEGRTVLFVSHDLAAVKKLCTRAILLSKGQIIKSGNPEDVVSFYLQSAASKTQHIANIEEAKGNKSFTINSIELLNEHNDATIIIESGKDLNIKLNYLKTSEGPDPIVIISIKNNLEQILFTCLSRESYNGVMQLNNTGSIYCTIPKLPLLAGQYKIDVTLKYGFDVTFSLENILTFDVERADFFGTGKMHHGNQNGMIVYHTWTVN